MGMIFIHAEDRGDLYHNVVGIPSAYHHYHLLSHGKIDGQNWHILFSLYFKYRRIVMKLYIFLKQHFDSIRFKPVVYNHRIRKPALIEKSSFKNSFTTLT